MGMQGAGRGARRGSQDERVSVARGTGKGPVGGDGNYGGIVRGRGVGRRGRSRGGQGQKRISAPEVQETIVRFFFLHSFLVWEGDERDRVLPLKGSNPLASRNLSFSGASLPQAEGTADHAR